jgi:uncharacterized membrane protein
MAKKILRKIKKLPKSAFFKFDAHYRAFISLVIGIVAFLITRTHFNWPMIILITWVAVALSMIIMDWIIIFYAHPSEIRKIARLQDSSRALIFLLVIVASFVSLGAILFLLKSTKGGSDAQITEHILLGMASVIVSWWLVHTLFTMRYAHLYYSPDKDAPSEKLKGLEFPGDEKDPDYLDFVYFSFVVGMTFQVSDIDITSRQIRRLTLMHALIAFAFNTAIVALSINVVSSLV